MSRQKTLILDGTRAEDGNLDSICNLLADFLLQDNGTKAERIKLKDIKINHCIGCFQCWTKTPGKCIYVDAGNDILEKFINSDTVILITPVVFGGYSSELKKIVDRLLPVALPFFKKTKHDETHHPPRYLLRPRFVGIGIHPRPREEVRRCFKTLVGRNAINADVDYTAEIVSESASPETLRARFRELLARTDRLPWGNELALLLPPATVAKPETPPNTGRALLIIGSPKRKDSCTSAVLGEHLLKRLVRHKWETESLCLTEDIQDSKGRSTLCAAVDQADAIIISFPLYIDSLPFLMTKAIEIIASHRARIKNDRKQKLYVLINNGFPESLQCAVALAICHNFSTECGMTWSGAITLGAGEALVSGQPLAGFKGGALRPPLLYVIRALNITADAIAMGCPIPEKAVRLIAKKPLPFISFDAWRWLFMQVSSKKWKKMAKQHALAKQRLFDKPYTN
ncbi:MAG: flavodoxin family protein [Candidatus Electrothrix sp. Rat3]|nr:flavodoxin family protein [Candidatus Electrothrix rattekaaiensis]